jgi:hypothetical protein
MVHYAARKMESVVHCCLHANFSALVDGKKLKVVPGEHCWHRYLGRRRWIGARDNGTVMRQVVIKLDLVVAIIENTSFELCG